jgi:hypothetical protein
MADWKGVPLRRWLRSADRLSDSATARGLWEAKTMGSRSSALLPVVTRCDQRDGEVEDACAIHFEEQFRYRPMAD